MRSGPLSLDEYQEGILRGNPVILGRAITLVESRRDTDRALAYSLIRSILPKTGRSVRIGVSGVPGVGKSTFIEALGKHLTSLKKKVAVLAIDPTSTRSKGSILGDKTRMEELSKDPLAFVRPSATGGQLGGVAGKTREGILLCEAAGFEVILVETVGVGQSEIAARGMVDFFLLLMLARAGDELQGLKKGIIELADGILINKADGDHVAHARQALADLQLALHFLAPREPGRYPRVLTCSSTQGQGIAEAWGMIDSFTQWARQNGSLIQNRKEQNQLWMEESMNEMMDNAKGNSASFQLRRTELQKQARDLGIYPPDAGRMLWEEFFSIRQ